MKEAGDLATEPCSHLMANLQIYWSKYKIIFNACLKKGYKFISKDVLPCAVIVYRYLQVFQSIFLSDC